MKPVITSIPIERSRSPVRDETGLAPRRKSPPIKAQAPSARDYAIKRDPVEAYQEKKDKFQKLYNFVCGIANILFGEHVRKPAYDPDSDKISPRHKAFRCGRNLLDEKSIPYRDQFKDVHFVPDELCYFCAVPRAAPFLHPIRDDSKKCRFVDVTKPLAYSVYITEPVRRARVFSELEIAKGSLPSFTSYVGESKKSPFAWQK
ncbi:hypothetical protein PILCRDRAFT_178 [Piloderma croceum F 1598]|uniref:Uncharacterized protein n=1 Tax=Piloderma croceum (strain F 1598) TaxID=765440 RepID=A0A0C3CQW6_PILCF|nr:hypothetical protein PILCRDRAFT_178 [Piloderma croceum F 1598]